MNHTPNALEEILDNLAKPDHKTITRSAGGLDRRIAEAKAALEKLINDTVIVELIAIRDNISANAYATKKINARIAKLRTHGAKT